MNNPAALLAAVALIALAVALIGWWRAAERADRAETARDTAIEQRDTATAAANQHWRALRRAQNDLSRYRRNLSEADHWAGVPRETPPPADSIDRRPFEQPTVLLPQYPEGTPEYDAYVTELRAELGKFAAGQPPYEYDRPTTVLPVINWWDR